MKHYIVFFFCICFYYSGLAQIADSVIKYQTFDAELNASSQKTNRGCYYEVITQKLKTGDKIFLSYSSAKYKTRMYIKSPSGKSDTISDCLNTFPKSASYSEFCFYVAEGGTYDFYLTSVEPHAVGQSTLMLASGDDRLIRIDPTWDICKKLNYILSLSHTDFQFISSAPYPQNKDIGVTFNCKLFNEASPIIIGLANCKESRIFKTIYIKDVELATAKTMMEGVDKQMRNCLSSDWTIEDNPGNKLPEIDYIQKGSSEHELNKVHKQNDFKNKISLKIEKRESYYSAVLEIY